MSVGRARIEGTLYVERECHRIRYVCRRRSWGGVAVRVSGENAGVLRTWGLPGRSTVCPGIKRVTFRGGERPGMSCTHTLGPGGCCVGGPCVEGPRRRHPVRSAGRTPTCPRGEPRGRGVGGVRSRFAGEGAPTEAPRVSMHGPRRGCPPGRRAGRAGKGARRPGRPATGRGRGGRARGARWKDDSAC